jgi:hypothetical protein
MNDILTALMPMWMRWVEGLVKNKTAFFDVKSRGPVCYCKLAFRLS